MTRLISNGIVLLRKLRHDCLPILDRETSNARGSYYSRETWLNTRGKRDDRDNGDIVDVVRAITRSIYFIKDLSAITTPPTLIGPRGGVREIPLLPALISVRSSSDLSISDSRGMHAAWNSFLHGQNGRALARTRNEGRIEERTNERTEGRKEGSERNVKHFEQIKRAVRVAAILHINILLARARRVKTVICGRSGRR